jgi:Na+/glutamate symporter
MHDPRLSRPALRWHRTGLRSAIRLASALAVAGTLLGGCAIGPFAQNLYEGLRVNDRAARLAPNEDPHPRLPDYDTYARERQRQIDRR